MAFDTIQVQGQEISLEHECPSSDKKENEPAEELEQEGTPEDPVAAHNAAISV